MYMDKTKWLAVAINSLISLTDHWRFLIFIRSLYVIWGFLIQAQEEEEKDNESKYSDPEDELVMYKR